jgi:hypothetical protein
MARKTLQYTVQDEGRDKGKVFLITEMSASHAESWAARAILALMAGGVELPEGFERFGMAGIAELGIKALSRLKWEDAQPLLDEMWACVQILPNPAKPNIIRALIEEDIEEVATRVKLRAEIWKLHVGFSQAAAKSNSGDSPASAIKRP